MKLISLALLYGLAWCFIGVIFRPILVALLVGWGISVMGTWLSLRSMGRRPNGNGPGNMDQQAARARKSST
jgi:hypothetical protein